MCTLNLLPFSLSSDEGALIAGAVLAVWAVGFAFRMVIQTLNFDGVKTESE